MSFSSRQRSLVTCAVFLCPLSATAGLVPITPIQGQLAFKSATETFFQRNGSTGPHWTAARAIDGFTSTGGGTDFGSGWAIRGGGSCDTPPTCSQSALFVLATPLIGSYNFTFRLDQGYGNFTTLDTFGLRYTTDANPTLQSSNTQRINITGASSINGTTFSLLPRTGGGTLIDAGGVNPVGDIYTLTTQFSSALPITGFYLDAIEIENDNINGPGRAVNGNFALVEFQVGVIPEPSGIALMLAGLGAAVSLRKKLPRARKITTRV